MNSRTSLQARFRFLNLVVVLSIGPVCGHAGATTAFDPEAALRGVNFDPAATDGNGQGEGHSNPGNGLLDLDEMATGRLMDRFFGPDGDADGDGVTNRPNTPQPGKKGRVMSTLH